MKPIRLPTTDIFVCACGHLRMPIGMGHGTITTPSVWDKCPTCQGEPEIYDDDSSTLEYPRKQMLDNDAKLGV